MAEIPPAGCNSWLDAAVQTLAGFHPSLRDSAVGAKLAREELNAIRARANLSRTAAREVVLEPDTRKDGDG